MGQEGLDYRVVASELPGIHQPYELLHQLTKILIGRSGVDSGQIGRAHLH